MPICGPKLLFQGLMGIFYYVHSVALAEDLPGVEEPHTPNDLDEFYANIDRGYTQVGSIDF
jgi:ribonuclease kappa